MTRVSSLGRLLARALLLAGLWWVLADGSFYTWPVGVAVVVLATALTWRLSPPTRPRGRLARRTWAAVSLLGWFLWRSAAGGVDVARRALTRAPDTDPQYVDHRFRLPPGTARVTVLYISNLMPGSLAVDLTGDHLRIHSIATELPTLEQVRELEERVARVAGLELSKAPRGDAGQGG